MNKMKWVNPEVPLSVLALKLCEEAAEVGGEITDGMMNPERVNVQATVTELSHVEFIAAVMRWRLTGEITHPDVRVAVGAFMAGG